MSLQRVISQMPPPGISQVSLALTGILLRFLDSQPCPFTIVLPDPFPLRYWWPVVSGRAQDFVRLWWPRCAIISHVNRSFPFSSFALRPLVEFLPSSEILCLGHLLGYPSLAPSRVVKWAFASKRQLLSVLPTVWASKIFSYPGSRVQKAYKIDLAHLLLDARIKELDSSRASRVYQHQNTQLESELSSFLASFQPQKTLFSATPKDIVRFLVCKDGKGETMVH